MSRRKSTRMRTSTLLIAVLVAKCVICEKPCGVYDATENPLQVGVHVMGTVQRDVKRGSFLPGEIRFENVRPVGLKSEVCSARMDFDGERLRFFVTDPLPPLTDGCVFRIEMEKNEECPETTPTEITVLYNVTEAPGFDKDHYTFQWSFPVAKGTKLNDVDIVFKNASHPVRVMLEEHFEGVELVRIPSPSEKTTVFELRATKLLYLQEDLNLTLIAVEEGTTSGESNPRARLTLRVNEDSAVPKPEFEKSFYDVTVRASQLHVNGELYPAGTIKLQENYTRLKLDVQPLKETPLRFEVALSTCGVNIKLSQTPPANLTSQDVILQLTGRISNNFGVENKGSTILLIRLVGIPQCIVEAPVVCDMENPEHLRIAVIVLSVVIVILLFLLMYGYFKYVIVRKPPPPPPPCKKCSAPVVKTRRPTPRKISEYPYPLDIMAPPLETLAETETEEENEGKGTDVKVAIPTETIPVPSTSGVKTRKRSLTFRESDKESRQNRETMEVPVTVHQNERKTSSGSRRSSREEERRRKSSAHMYRCLS